MSDIPSFTKGLWSRGWPLDDAAHRIAPRELFGQLEKPYPEIRKDMAMELPNDGSWAFRALAATAVISTALGPILEHFHERLSVRDEIRDNLLIRIEGGEFIAIGYALPRKHSDLPVEIPIDIWEGEPDWENSAVSGNGLAYTAVRIIPAILLDKSPEITAPLQIAPPAVILPENSLRAPGRPSNRKLIQAAYEELKKSGKFDFRGPQKSVIRQIRHFVMAKFSEGLKGERGLGDEAIRKVINADFLREREAAESARNL